MREDRGALIWCLGCGRPELCNRRISRDSVSECGAVAVQDGAVMCGTVRCGHQDDQQVQYVTAHEELGGVADLTCRVSSHARVVAGVVWPHVSQGQEGGERVVLCDLEVGRGREGVSIPQPLELHGRVTDLDVAGDGGPHPGHQGSKVKGLDGGRHCKRGVRGGQQRSGLR